MTEGAGTGSSAGPRPASTVALLRPAGIDEAEVLLTHRPATMAFGPGLHVFPGGAVDPADGDADGPLARRSALDPAACARAWGHDLGPAEALAHAVAAVRELYEEAGVLLARRRDGAPAAPGEVAAAAAAREPLERLAERLDLVLATDALVPLARWVTPPTPGAARRYDARVYVADAPAGVAVEADAREVVAHAWLPPGAALARYAAGAIDLWPPTSVTLRQLLPAADAAAVRRRWPVSRAAAPVAERLDPSLLRVRLGAAGGIPGRTVDAWVVGRRRVLVVDPGDPTERGLEALLAAGAAGGRTIAGVVVTSSAPDQVAGAVGIALVADVPLLASPDAAPLVGDPCRAVADGEIVRLADVPLRVRLVPGSPDGCLVLQAADGRFVLTGDLDARSSGPGPRGGFSDGLAGRRLPARG